MVASADFSETINTTTMSNCRSHIRSKHPGALFVHITSEAVNDGSSTAAYSGIAIAIPPLLEEKNINP